VYLRLGSRSYRYIGSFVSMSQSIVLLLAPTQIIARHRAPLLLWMFEAGLGPHSITFICCGFVVQLTYNLPTLQQRLKCTAGQVYNNVCKKSTTSCTTNPQQIGAIELEPTYRVI